MTPDGSIDVTVVIPVRNGALLIGEQLEALATQDASEPFEVVVSDNGSTDATREVVAAFGSRLPFLRVVDAGERQGSAHARNRGVAAGRGSRLIFADADDVVGECYVRIMAGALVENAAVAARIEWQRLNGWGDPARLPVIQTAGVSGGLFGWLPFAMGGAMAIRRDAFEQIGGFDETVPRADDVEFCWRLGLAGISITFVPEAIVHYRLRTGVRETFRQNRVNGRDAPWLYRRFRNEGMPRHGARAALRFWLGPLRVCARCRSRSELIGCAALVGMRVGMLEGSLRYRTAYF